MRTSKKLLSVLLAVLMCMSCFGLCLNAAAVNELSSIALACPAPEAGSAFPTVSDVECAPVLQVKSIIIYEVQGNTSVKATAPFENGKTYEINFSMATRTANYNFSNDLTASVNDEACNAVYLTRTTANVVWTVTVGNFVTVTVEAVNGYGHPTTNGTVTGGGTYPFGTEVTVSATPNPGYLFLEWAEYKYDETYGRFMYTGTSINLAEHTFTATEDAKWEAKFVPVEESFHLVGVAEPQEGGTVDGTGWCWFGNSASLYATANEGWYFLGWYEGETLLTHDARFSDDDYYAGFNAGDEITVTAKFLPQDALIPLKSPDFDDMEIGDWYYDINEFALNAATQSGTEMTPDQLQQALLFATLLFGNQFWMFDPVTETVVIQTMNIMDASETIAIHCPGDDNYDLVRTAIHQSDKKVVQNWVRVKDPDHETMQRGDWFFDVDFYLVRGGFGMGQYESAETYQPGLFQTEEHIQRRTETMNSLSGTEMRYNPATKSLILIDAEGNEARDGTGLISRFIRPYKYRITLNEVDLNNLKNGDWYMEGGPLDGGYYSENGEYHFARGEIIQYAPEDKEISIILGSYLGIVTLYPGDEVTLFVYENEVKRYEDYAAYIKQYRDPSVQTYTVTANASAGGTAAGSGTYDEGATATLTATPGSGYHFTGWYEGSTKVSDKTPYSFTVTKDVTLTAQFEKDADPGNNGGNNNPQPQPSPNRCHWCGKDHSGNFFQKIIGFFHNIFAKIFGNRY